jgi:hypothetical protein
MKLFISNICIYIGSISLVIMTGITLYRLFLIYLNNVDDRPLFWFIFGIIIFLIGIGLRV